MHPDQAVAWEERWARPTAVATFGAVGLLVASVILGASLGGGGEAASLRDLHDQASTVTLVSLIQAVGFLLLALPLIYLFRAARARRDRVRAQFLPLVVAAPLALSIASVLNGASANDAASAFVNGEGTSSLTKVAATKECHSEQRDDAAGFRDDFGAGSGALGDCATSKIEDDEAEDAVESTSLRPIAEGVQFAGLLALAFALIYTCLHAMRAGLLTRFWGSFGIAIGAASVLGLFQLGIIWFFYFGLLVVGWIPGGRPPAWAAGESIPWPSPGERAAAALEEPEEDDEDEGPSGSAPPPPASSESESR